ncbi:MAG: NfeD family protein [Gammaproteobacteria bacterium]
MDDYTPIFWHWWILGVGLVILEVFAPGTFFLWMGISAGVTGLALWLFPELNWEWQLLLFALLSVIAIAASRPWIKRQMEKDTDQPLLNQRGKQYIGKRYQLTKPIINGSGQIKVGDTLWKVSGEDAAEGSSVEVVDAEGTVLIVEPVSH